MSRLNSGVAPPTTALGGDRNCPSDCGSGGDVGDHVMASGSVGEKSNHGVEAGESYTPEEEKMLLRKIDRVIMPFVCVLSSYHIFLQPTP